MAALTHRSADDLLASLGNLTSKETKTLLAQLALRVKAPQTRGDRDQETWASAVSDALSDALGSSAASALVHKEMTAASAWKPVLTFLEDSGFIDLTVAEKQSVYRYIAGLLVQYAAKISSHSRAPLSPHFVASCAGHIAQVFDAAFPGYIASGFGPMLVRRMCHGDRTTL